ncbi:MAG TPA: outer membrane beta-barrel protein [Burkholderiaceae bacterium]|nr:outer membrane beta-barrel protein [Burkholderiaceae bacterium]
MKRTGRLVVLACVLALTAPVTALAENSVTAFGGWRASGTLEDSVAQRNVRLRDSAAFSAALDLTFDETRQLEFFASHQSTSLAVTRIGSTTTMRLPVKVSYFHFGGTNYFDGPAGIGPFVAGGLGFTRLAPGLDGFESETKASLSVALGYSLPLGRYAALRVEGRGYWTLINSSGNLFCSGGCTITIKGDTLQQVEMLVGVSARF